MGENVTATVGPSRKQIALQLACAIMSNPSLTYSNSTEQAVEEALRVLNLLEQRLRLGQTRAQPAD